MRDVRDQRPGEAEMLRRAAADRLQRLALDGAPLPEIRQRWRMRWRRSAISRCELTHECFDVLRRDTAERARAGDAAQVHAQLAGEVPRRRTGRHHHARGRLGGFPLRRTARGRAIRRDRLCLARRWLRWRLLWGWFGRFGLYLFLGASFPLRRLRFLGLGLSVFDQAERLTGIDVVALLDEKLDEP